MKKIVSLVLNHFTNDNRVLKENISLKRNGFDVVVVALYKKGLNEFDEQDTIPIHRIKSAFDYWSRYKIVRLYQYMEFVYKSVKYYKNNDLFHCNDLHTLPIALIIKKIFNCNVKIVYDAHEYETETHNLKGFTKKLIKVFEKLAIYHVDKVITVSDSIANEYTRLYGIKKPKIVLNTPFFQKIQKQNLFREKFNIQQDQIIFLYQGGLMKGRGIEILLDTFKSLSLEKNNINYPVIVFLGYGPLASVIDEESKLYKNIYLHEAVSPKNLLDYTSSADFGISTIEDICLSYRYCLPNKMFEYLMADIAVIVSNLPEMKKVVENNKVGIVIENNTIADLKKVILDAIKLDKIELENNIQNFKKIYNWEEQEKILLEVYNNL